MSSIRARTELDLHQLEFALHSGRIFVESWMADTYRKCEVLDEEGKSVLGIQRCHDVGEVVRLRSSIVNANNNVNLQRSACIS